MANHALHAQQTHLSAFTIPDHCIPETSGSNRAVEEIGLKSEEYCLIFFLSFSPVLNMEG
jgi:hypothetical protein